MIRIAQKDDIDAIAGIWLDANIYAHNFIDPAYWHSNFDTVKDLLAEAEVYVYEDRDGIRGFIGLDHDYIPGIFVCSGYRSRNIGKRLMDFAKKIRNELTLNVYEKNTRAVKFYQREHFKIIQTDIDKATNEKEYSMMWKQSVKGYTYITLRQKPELKESAAAWFHDKWNVPKESYLECMDAYLNNETEYGWYLCLDRECIAGGLGVIENDFHDRKDLSPNICALYTEKEYRCNGIAGYLLNMAVKDMKDKGFSPVYLITDHKDFYEKYGWEFLCMVHEDDGHNITRMYIHR